MGIESREYLALEEGVSGGDGSEGAVEHSGREFFFEGRGIASVCCECEWVLVGASPW